MLLGYCSRILSQIILTIGEKLLTTHSDGKIQKEKLLALMELETFLQFSYLSFFPLKIHRDILEFSK